MPGCERLVEMRGIVKRYPGVVANDHVDFVLCRGEIHGLLGENGAGKTTLMSILYGSVRPDEGVILYRGEAHEPRSPRDSLRKGIVMVHQHFKLVERLTVLDNLMLAARSAGRRLSRSEARRLLARIGEEYGLRVDPEARVWQLSAGERQRAELARALALGAEVIILDEPTTVLTPPEVEGLFRFMRKAAGEGRGIVFITHKLREALSICDRITVLRRGRTAGTVDLRERRIGESELARMMFGEEPPPPPVRARAERGVRVLLVEDLWVRGDRGHWAVKGVSFSVFEGEILGIAGVAGSGQRELVEAIAGLRRPERGRILLDGFDASSADPRSIVDAGVSYIPEDRLGMAVARGLSVAENAVLRGYWRKPFSRGIFLDWRAVRAHASRLVKAYEIAVADLDAPVESLSGGNMQKLVVAREFSLSPRLLIAFNPTSGLDARATSYIRRELASLADGGSAVLLVSEDMDEVLELSDRVAAMYNGELVGPIPRRMASREVLGGMMATGEVALP